MASSGLRSLDGLCCSPAPLPAPSLCASSTWPPLLQAEFCMWKVSTEMFKPFSRVSLRKSSVPNCSFFSSSFLFFPPFPPFHFFFNWRVFKNHSTLTEVLFMIQKMSHLSHHVNPLADQIKALQKVKNNKNV